MSEIATPIKGHRSVGSLNGHESVTPIGVDKLVKEREPPHSPYYSFSFRIPRTIDRHVQSDKKLVTFYCYIITIRRTDLFGNTKVHEYGTRNAEDVTSPVDHDSEEIDTRFSGDTDYQKRWSEIDAFDREWFQELRNSVSIDEQSEIDQLYDELRLDPYRLSKLTSPVTPSLKIKSKRTNRFIEYINAMMSDPRLHHYLARFLQIPLDILVPPSYTQKEIESAQSSSVMSSPSSTMNGSNEAPLQYTRRKIKRRAHHTSYGGSMMMDGSGFATPMSQDMHGGAGGGGSNFLSSPFSSSSSGIAALAASSSSQHLPNGTPNTHWSGPTLEEWTRFMNDGLTCLKLPHSHGLLSKSKLRQFHLLPMASTKAQAKLAAARKKDRFYIGLESKPSAYLLEWNSSKSDILDTFFLLGHPDIPWSIIYEQKDTTASSAFARHRKKDSKSGEFHSQYDSQRNRSITIHYRDGSLLKTLDLISQSDEDMKLIKRVFDFIEWKQKNLIQAEPNLPEVIGMGVNEHEPSQSVATRSSISRK